MTRWRRWRAMRLFQGTTGTIRSIPHGAGLAPGWMASRLCVSSCSSNPSGLATSVRTAVSASANARVTVATGPPAQGRINRGVIWSVSVMSCGRSSRLEPAAQRHTFPLLLTPPFSLSLMSRTVCACVPPLIHSCILVRARRASDCAEGVLLSLEHELAPLHPCDTDVHQK